MTRNHPERARQNAICTVLDAFQIPHAITDAGVCFRAGKQVGGVPGRGWPDITACLPPNGRFWGIEVKSTIGRLSADQKDRRDEIEYAGGVYTLARGVDDVMAVIEGSRT